MKRTILTFIGGYLPGYKGGGIIRSVASLVEILGDEFDFKIITLDRDLDGTGPHPGIKVNDWQKVGKAEVFYVSPDKATLLFLRHLINSTPYDALYFNSFFTPKFTIKPMLLRRLGLIRSAATIIAPEGEFSPGALRIKTFKKRVFIQLAKRAGLYRNVIWRASSKYEMTDIRTVLDKDGPTGTSLTVFIAPNLTTPAAPKKEVVDKEKKVGSLNAVFLSRISPKKNLAGALANLHGVQGKVAFTIYGPLEDKVYWEKCQRIIDTLPSNIAVSYKGEVCHDEVADVFSDHDLFFFPTHGENYGHVIVEALAAGCPLLISDQTPWRNLEQSGVGWDIPLDQPDRFTAVLQRCVNMGNDELRALSQKAREYGLKKIINQESVQQNRDLFNFGVNRASLSASNTGKD